MESPILTDKDYNLWVLLHQTRDAIFNIRERELSQYRITAIEAGVLFIIQTNGNNVTPAEISRWIFRRHHTVTALLNRMEKKGLITKARDKDRKNIWRVSLTEKGQNALGQSLKRDSIHTALSSLSDEEHKRLESYLRKVRNKALEQQLREPTLPFP